jgi:NitT/TauT family transport system ATP-binding protein
VAHGAPFGGRAPGLSRRDGGATGSARARQPACAGGGRAVSAAGGAAAGGAEGPAGSVPALEVVGLRKGYAKDGRAMRVLDLARLAVEEGEFVTVVGPSGCGKSTLLHILGGFIAADAGEIRVYGRGVTGPGPDRGMMFQEFALFPWRTVAGNVAWSLEVQGRPRAEREATVDRYLALMSLSDFRHHLPGELSGGMKQRVALARVLAFDPQVLLMDEPFGSLDAQTRETMQEELTRLWERTAKTILFVTHDIEEAVYLGDRVLVLSARPARVRQEVRIDLPRPRDLTVKKSIRCLEYRNQIWDLIRGEAQATRGSEA